MSNQAPKEVGNTVYQGHLYIDHENGVIKFKSDGIRILRITHLKAPIPRGSSIDLAAISQLVSYVPLPFYEPNRIAEAKERSMAIHPSTGIYSKLSNDDRCDTCHEVHVGNNKDAYDEPGKFSFYPGHEYIITTKTNAQRYPRVSRMGYLGRPYPASHMLQFNARGPDRTHDGQYGGTQVIDARIIVEVEEVPREVVKRHTETIKKD